MSIQNFLKALTSNSTRRWPARRHPTTARLRLEPLEDRRLLAFSAPVDYGADQSPLAVVAADFNGDGRLDLATANQDNAVSVLLGNGDGAFQAPRTSAAGAGYALGSLVADDLNRDGNADLVTFNPHSTNITLLFGNDDGTFQSPQSITLPPQVPPDEPDQGNLVQAPVSVALGDSNSDGKFDIVAGSQTVWFTTVPGPQGDYLVWHVNSYANVLLGNGDGTFSPTVVKHLAGGYPRLYPGDFNNDGWLDIVLGGGSALGNGDGTLQDFVQSSVYVGDQSQSVGDLNGDGNLDLLSNLSHVGGPFLQLGNGDGTFQQGQTLDHNYYQWGTVAGDINADGKLDVVSVRSDYEWSDVYGNYAYITATNRSARVLLAGGNGSFSQPIIVDFGTAAGQADFISPILADFDGDGFLDLAATERFTSDEGAIVYGGVHVALNDGNWMPPPPPPPSITMNDATVTEGNTGSVNATFTLTLSHASAVDVTVHFATADITATAGPPQSDYIARSGTVTIPGGQTSKTFTVAVKGDRLGEPTETFAVNLTAPTNATIGDAQAIGTILDNEPRISITDFTKSEGKQGKTTLFTFTVMLSAAYDQSVTVNYATANGSATTVDNDYIAKSGTLTFAPGVTSKTITIKVKGDSKQEAHETYFIRLANAVNSYLLDDEALATILNDD